MIDVVTVFYNEKTKRQTEQLFVRIAELHDPEVTPFSLVAVDNTVENRGFSKACNLGAKEGNGEILAFINPDVEIDGPFLGVVEQEFAKDAALQITGCRFDKPKEVLDTWRLPDWICGATFFVRRSWFGDLGGFDERYVWSFEETDMLQATFRRLGPHAVKSIRLPVRHESPDPEFESLEVVLYKHYHLQRGWRLYREKWGFAA